MATTTARAIRFYLMCCSGGHQAMSPSMVHYPVTAQPRSDMPGMLAARRAALNGGPPAVAPVSGQSGDFAATDNVPVQQRSAAAAAAIRQQQQQHQQGGHERGPGGRAGATTAAASRPSNGWFGSSADNSSAAVIEERRRAAAKLSAAQLRAAVVAQQGNTPQLQALRQPFTAVHPAAPGQSAAAQRGAAVPAEGVIVIDGADDDDDDDDGLVAVARSGSGAGAVNGAHGGRPVVF